MSTRRAKSEGVPDVTPGYPLSDSRRCAWRNTGLPAVPDLTGASPNALAAHLRAPAAVQRSRHLLHQQFCLSIVVKRKSTCAEQPKQESFCWSSM